MRPFKLKLDPTLLFKGFSGLKKKYFENCHISTCQRKSFYFFRKKKNYRKPLRTLPVPILYEFLRKNSDPHPVKIDPNPVQKNVLLFSYLEKPLQVVNLAQSHGHEYQGLK